MGRAAWRRGIDEQLGEGGGGEQHVPHLSVLDPQEAGGAGDDVDPVNATGTLSHDFGADGAGTVAWLDTGAPGGFTYVLSGGNLLINQDHCALNQGSCPEGLVCDECAASNNGCVAGCTAFAG